MLSARTFNQVILDAAGSAGDYPRGYQVNVSNDGTNWGSPVATGSGSSAAITITVSTQTARYIRVTQTGSVSSTIWWSIHELNVYGLFPSPWLTSDVGAVATIGSVSFSSPTWTIAGSGVDIGGTADALRYVYQSSTGECNVVARVTSLTNTSGSAKSDVMIRESTAVGAVNAMVCVTPGNGVSFQWRNMVNGTNGNVQIAGPTAPKWLKITRMGNSFAGFYSDNGTLWSQVGTAQTISMASSATMGLAVTSQNNDGTLCTSIIDNVTAMNLNSYASWADSNTGSGNPDEDFDKDGMSNGIEYFMGQTGSSFTPNPAMIGRFVTWPKDPKALATYIVQTSNNLTDWIPAPTGVVDNTASVNYTAPGARSPPAPCRRRLGLLIRTRACTRQPRLSQTFPIYDSTYMPPH